MTNFFELLKRYNPLAEKSAAAPGVEKCTEHNWLFDEFDEPCPLCEAVAAEQHRIVGLFQANDSACSEWAIGVIEEGSK